MTDLRTQFRKIFSTKRAAIFSIIVCEIFVGLLIFHAGTAYGVRHASGRMHAKEHTFLTSPFGILSHSFMPGEHGAVGTIMSISSSTLLLKTREGGTQTVHTDEHTAVRGPSGTMVRTGLMVGDTVTIVGNPNQNSDQINALFIRVVSSAATIPGR